MKHRGAFRGAAIATVLAGLAAGTLASAAPPPDAAVCVACHGMQGEGGASVPRLAGQDADYLTHALSLFRDGTREGVVMQAIARSINDAQSRALANYFSAQQAPLAAAASPSSPALVLAGRELAEHGSGNVAPCFSCHGSRGEGNGARFPRIASQPAPFLMVRLQEFQQRARAKAPDPGSMTAVSAQMSTQQIEAAAAYLSTLEPEAATSASPPQAAFNPQPQGSRQ
jgi:cytochrome c553